MILKTSKMYFHALEIIFHYFILLLERYCFHLHCSESDWNGSCMEIMGCCSIHALLSPFTVLFYYSLPPPIHRIFSQCIAELQPKSCVFRENLMHLYFVFCKWWNELKCKCKDAHVMVRFSKKQEFINFLLKDSQNILHSDQSRLYFTFSIRRQRSLMPAAEAEVRRRCCKSAAEAYFCVTMCCEINSTL